jgi:hypothetical protein
VRRVRPVLERQAQGEDRALAFALARRRERAAVGFGDPARQREPTPSPLPSPSPILSSGALPWTNMWKIRSSMPGSMPRPVSRTWTATQPCSRRACTTILPACGV